MEMQLAVFITWLLASVPLPSQGETIGHVTRDYFGDIFTLGDCEPGSCDQAGRRAAQIPGERCRCQCAPSHYTFREDMRQCIKDVGECPVAMFVRPFAVERIPLVFLPMTGQLVYPGAHLTVSGIARMAPSKHLSCNVKSSLLMTSHGWKPIRTPSAIFGIYYDGNKTFLQWLGDDEDRKKLQHHLVLIRLSCEGENSNGTFEPCAALRVGWVPGLDSEPVSDMATGKNNYVIIGLCLGILGLVYVGAVLIYLKVRKRKRSGSRQGLAPSRTTMESNDEEDGLNGNSQTRSAYISNLVQEAELTSKKSPSKVGTISAPENGHVSPNRAGPIAEASSSGSPSGMQMTNNPLYETQGSNDSSSDSPSSSPAQPASPEFFLRIRSMITAAKNRLNSFRYRPTLLVIPEDDYFYQDFKERDIDVTNGDKKTLERRLTNKSSKMESIHGSHLGAVMLGAKVAPPLPPPRQVKCKSKKKAPSPPGKRRNYPLPDRYDSTSPQNREVNGECDPAPAASSPTDGLSKFDIFRIDLYEKINRIRDGSSRENAENGTSVIHSSEGGERRDEVHETEQNVELHSEPPELSGKTSQKISRRQLIHKLQENESDRASPCREISSRNSNGDISQKSKPQTPTSTRSYHLEKEEDQDDDDDWASSRAGSVIGEASVLSITPLPYSRPGTAASNRSLPTSISSSVHPRSSSKGRRKSAQVRNGGRRKKQKREERGRSADDDEEERSEVASLSGDSLNSSFRRPTKSPSSVKSKRSRRSVVDDDGTEDTSVISVSSMVTTSTAIKELQDDYDDDDDEEDYDETMDEEDSRFSTDLDPEDFSMDESEHPSLEEYLQLSSQVAKKLSERTVPEFSGNSQREKNVLTQFMKEFKTTIGRLRTADEGKPRTSRPGSPGGENWTLRKEEKAKSARVARKVSLFKRNPLKSRKHHAEELLADDENRKNNGYYDINAGMSETDDTISCISESSSFSGKGRSKSRTPEIVPAAKMTRGAEKTIIAITTDDSQTAKIEHRVSPASKAVISNGVSIPRIGKAVTPPLPPPKPSLEELQSKAANFRKELKLRHSPPNDKNSGVSPVPNGDLRSSKVMANNRRNTKSPARVVRTPSFESDSISVANSDMTEDSLNTPAQDGDDRDEDDDDVEEDGPIDRALEQLADSVIQPPDDCSLNRYLSHLGTVLAAREDNALDQCLNKLASNMNGSRATKGFNLSQHLPLGTWEHVCFDRVTSDRSTPTSELSSTSRGSKSSQDHLRKKTLTKSKHHHHHHHHRNGECKHGNGHIPDHPQSPAHGNHVPNHLTNGRFQPPLPGNDSYTTRIHVERSGNKMSSNNIGGSRITCASEDDTESRASSLGSTRELETPVSEIASDPSSVDFERSSRKKRPLGRRSKKGLNGTCRQHIQNSRLGKDGDPRTLKKIGSKQKSSDVTVIQLEGDPINHVTNVDSTNTFVTLINVDSSDCSNSAEEK